MKKYFLLTAVYGIIDSDYNDNIESSGDVKIVVSKKEYDNMVLYSNIAIIFLIICLIIAIIVCLLLRKDGFRAIKETITLGKKVKSGELLHLIRKDYIDENTTIDIYKLLNNDCFKEAYKECKTDNNLNELPQKFMYHWIIKRTSLSETKKEKTTTVINAEISRNFHEALASACKDLSDILLSYEIENNGSNETLLYKSSDEKQAFKKTFSTQCIESILENIFPEENIEIKLTESSDSHENISGSLKYKKKTK